VFSLCTNKHGSHFFCSHAGATTSIPQSNLTWALTHYTVLCVTQKTDQPTHSHKPQTLNTDSWRTHNMFGDMSFVRHANVCHHLKWDYDTLAVLGRVPASCDRCILGRLSLDGTTLSSTLAERHTWLSTSVIKLSRSPPLHVSGTVYDSTLRWHLWCHHSAVA